MIGLSNSSAVGSAYPKIMVDLDMYPYKKTDSRIWETGYLCSGAGFTRSRVQ